MGSFKNCLMAVMITLIAANTLAIGLRVWVRTRLMKVYGWDDLALVIAYLGFLIGCGFGFATIYFGFAADPDDDTTNFDYENMMKYYAANQYSLYISSGIIKIAVALVLYRLACGLKSQVILVMAIVVMVIWTFITTIFAMDLCASTGAASYTGDVACSDIGYFRMISNIFIDYFFALFPIPMLWAATLSRRMKVIVCCLLGLGFIASAATVAKLILLVQLNEAATQNDPDKIQWIHTQLLIWSDAELGIAIFTATMSGLRPLVRRLMGRKPVRWSDKTANNNNNNNNPSLGNGLHRGAYPRALVGDSTRQALHNRTLSSRNTSGGTKVPFAGRGAVDDNNNNLDEEFEMRSMETTIHRPRDNDLINDEENSLHGYEGDDDYHAQLRRSETTHLGRPQNLQTSLSMRGFPPPLRMPTLPPPAKIHEPVVQSAHETKDKASSTSSDSSGSSDSSSD
ncbi:unnamed protein product [Discula destructiva]